MYSRVFEGTIAQIGDYSLGNVFRLIGVQLDDGHHADCLIKCDPQGVAEIPAVGTRVQILAEEKRGIWTHVITALDSEIADEIIGNQIREISLYSRRT